MARHEGRGSRSLVDLSRTMENGHAVPPDRSHTQLTSPTTLHERQAVQRLGPFDGSAPYRQIEPQPSRAHQLWTSAFEKLKGRKTVAGVALAEEFHELILEARRAEPPAGYPALAEFLASDERYFIFRKFSHLQARLILEKQDEMRQIEEDLDEADTNDKEATRIEFDDEGRRVPVTGGKLFTRHRRNEQEAKERKELFEKAERVFKEYTALLVASNQLSKMDKPAGHEWKSVSRVIEETKPVIRREASWIESRNRKDLVTLRKEREHAVFDAIVESVINYVKNSNGSRIEPNNINEEGKVQGFLRRNASAGKAANFINMVFLSVLVPGLFVIPIYVLSIDRVQNHIGASIGVLIAFATAFTAVLALGTPAKAHEVWSCAAAYLAVLVVFLGGITRSKGAPNG